MVKKGSEKGQKRVKKKQLINNFWLLLLVNFFIYVIV